MPNFAWLGQEAALSAAALTVRAQTISPNDTGRLLWDAFAPRQDVNSVKLNQITSIDWRPVSDRREWNARGRNINLRTPNLSAIEMVPIESNFAINEEEIQRLTEQTLGNQDLFRQMIRATVPERTDLLVESNYRRIEVDFFNAWALGTIVAKNPVTGVTTTVSYGFSASRYTTAGTAWNAVANAYTTFMTWLTSAIDLVGPIEGVVMRLATFNEILLDAPQGVNAVPLTRAQLRDRIQQELGTAFEFFILENSFDVYNDGGQDVTRTKVWPAQRVAIVPAGRTVGNVGFAPVARAFDVARAVPDAGIDVRGQSVFTEVTGNGRELTVECQVNALPILDENKLVVINAGV